MAAVRARVSIKSSGLQDTGPPVELIRLRRKCPTLKSKSANGMVKTETKSILVRPSGSALEPTERKHKGVSYLSYLVWSNLF